MDEIKYKSKYLPAARAADEELTRQVQFFSADTLHKTLLNAVPDAVMILNENRQIVFANEAVRSLASIRKDEKLLGLRPGELLGCMHAENQSGGCGTSLFCRVCGAAHVILSGIQGRDDAQECRIRRKDGTSLDLLVYGRPIIEQNQAFTIFSIQDIADQKRLQVLEHAFFHDVLNASGGIRNLLKVLPQLEPEEKEETHTLLISLADSMIEDIQSHRDLLAAENGELSIHMRRISVKNLFTELIDMYKDSYYALGKEIGYRSDKADHHIETDPKILQRCIGNILKNALEASPSGAKVGIGVREEGAFLTMWVHNPTYIPPEIQLQIFQRSFSTKDSKRGIGSYSIKLLAEKYLGGKVSFTSEEKEGTYFYVSIPK